MHRMFWAVALLGAMVAAPVNSSAAPQKAQASAPAARKAPARKAAPAPKASVSKKASAGRQAAKASAPGSSVPMNEDQIRAELNDFIRQYAESSNRRLSVNRAKPEVFKRGGKYVATFTEINPQSVHADMKKSTNSHFDYIALMTYDEMTYECSGPTRNDALKGPFAVTKFRRLTELPRYARGKWEN